MRRANICALFTAALFGQTPAFEVASVKPIQSEVKFPPPETIDSPPGNLTMRAVNLRSCLRWAYGVKEYQISGPAWMTQERYDILAKAPGAPPEQMKLMLQTLLADRFKLAFHRETRDLATYDIVPGKSGPKLQASKSPGPFGMKFNEGTVVLTNCTLQQLAERLSTSIFTLGRPVLDKTGIDGTYDFSIEMASSNMEMKMNVERGQGNPDPAPVAQALQRVGLKLEARKGPVEVLVIDRAEKVPTEN